MKERELEMYGCLRADIDAEIAEIIGPKEMYAMAILSDAQVVMGGNPELSRQYINKAKYVMSQILVEKLERV